MTACVNNEKKMKGGALSGKVARTFLAGALAATMVPSVAFAAPKAEQSGEASVLGIESADFTKVQFTWNVEPDTTGDYYLPFGTPFYVTSAQDVFGNLVPASDYQVIYVTDTDGEGDLDDTAETVYTTAPTGKGKYVAVLIEGGLPSYVNIVNGKTKLNEDIVDEDDTENNTTPDKSLYDVLTGAVAKKTVVKQTQPFEILAKSLEGAYFFQGDSVNDKTFKFTGNDFTYGLATADGEALKATDYDLVWVGSKPADNVDNDSNLIAPGTYTAVANGKGDYEGSTAKVSFTVDKIDLENDVFTVKTLEDGTARFADSTLAFNGTAVYVNGEELNSKVVTMTALGATGKDGIYKEAVDTATSGKVDVTATDFVGRVSMNVAPAASGTVGGIDLSSTDVFVDSEKTGYAEVEVVSDLATVKYDGIAAATSLEGEVFDSSKGEAFDAFLVEATNPAGDKAVSKTVRVFKDGVEVKDWSEPGDYTAVVSVPAPKDFSYGAYEAYDFTVVARQLNAEPVSYVSVDGKGLDSNDSATVEYDAEAVDTAIVVKAGTKTLTAGADYQVTYKDAMGKAVDSVVEPGTYTGTIDFLGAVYAQGSGKTGKVAPQTFTVVVEKAQARSAAPVKDVYEYTGEAVNPTFTVYSKEGLKGFSVTVDPSKTGATYYEVKLDNDETSKTYGEWVKVDETDAIKGSDLKEEGFYVAEVPVPSSDAHMQGSVESEVFEIAKKATFADVAAGEWYADPIYKARDLGYMNGYYGTAFFGPNDKITRAEAVAVIFNMAGGDASDEAIDGDLADYAGKFGDVDKDAWYAKALGWAAKTGIVSGYADGNFGPNDKITREQFAAMLCNYAKKNLDFEAADESVLGSFADAGSVSEWATESVAWAVANKVMGNGGAIDAQSDVSRAEVAAMAVNYQPEALK